MNQAVVGAFICTVQIVCPSTGEICNTGDVCYPNAPVGFDSTCGDIGGIPTSSVLPWLVAGSLVTPNGIIDGTDVQLVQMYLTYGNSELSRCYAPCRDPRLMPVPVARGTPSVPFRAPVMRK